MSESSVMNSIEKGEEFKRAVPCCAACVQDSGTVVGF